jgi:hypothetical protein
LADAILEHFFLANAQASPANLWLALNIADPEADDFTAVGKPVPGQSGAAASIIAGAPAGQMRVTGLTGMVADSVERELEISGAASGGNNGTFDIDAFVDVLTVDVINGAAVIPDANNGAISWVERLPPTELGSGIGYARQPVTFAAIVALAAGRRIDNDTNLTFGPATADWPAITYFSVHDAVSGGNMLGRIQMAGGKIVINGQSFGVGIGQTEITARTA